MNKLIAIATCLLLAFGIQTSSSVSAQCVYSSLTLDSVRYTGSNYRIYLMMRVGRGFDHVSDSTQTFAMGFFDNTHSTNNVTAWAPSLLLSTTTGHTYTGVNTGPQSTGPWAGAFNVLLFNGTGPLAYGGHPANGPGGSDMYQLEFVVDSLPDSIRVYGLEDDGVVGTACAYEADQKVSCFPLLPALPLQAQAGPNVDACAMTPVQIGILPAALGGTPPYSYNWFPTTNLNNPSIQTPIATGNGTTIYTLAVTDASGCVAYDQIVVTHANPTWSINLPDTVSVCGGDSVLLCSGQPGSWFHTWTNGSQDSCVWALTNGWNKVVVEDYCGVRDSDSVYIDVINLLVDLGPDTLTCDTMLTLDAGPGWVTHLWNQGATTQTIQVTNFWNPGNYWVQVVDANGCVANDSITIWWDSTCVWPGDANYDNIADNNDLLAIGIAFGANGPVRPWADTSWTAQSCPDWTGSFISGANYKHADCEGDGDVDSLDIPLINAHYGLTHSKSNWIHSSSLTAPALYFDGLQDSVGAGDTLVVKVGLGVDTLIADSVYGIAFTLTYDSSLVDSAGVWVNFDSSWLGTAGTNMIVLEQDLYGHEQIDIALSRTDGQNQDGFGEICRVSIVMQDDIVAKKQLVRPLVMELVEVQMITATEQQLEVNTSIDSLMVYDGETSMAPPFAAAPLEIWPNPTETRLRVRWQGQPILSAAFLDMRGQVVRQFAGNGSDYRSLDLRDLPAGVYFLRVRSVASVATRKVILVVP